MGAWNVVKNDKGEVISTGFCDFQQKHLAPGWTIESYDAPQAGMTPVAPKADANRVAAINKLKAIGLTDAELKALGL